MVYLVSRGYGLSIDGVSVLWGWVYMYIGFDFLEVENLAGSAGWFCLRRWDFCSWSQDTFSFNRASLTGFWGVDFGAGAAARESVVSAILRRKKER